MRVPVADRGAIAAWHWLYELGVPCTRITGMIHVARLQHYTIISYTLRFIVKASPSDIDREFKVYLNCGLAKSFPLHVQD